MADTNEEEEVVGEAWDVEEVSLLKRDGYVSNLLQILEALFAVFMSSCHHGLNVEHYSCNRFPPYPITF
ncbi:hypothetical protein M5K25_005568 [Dendrobium thyrsiflorum]|uniref:Uncharacterized protein n=1 Tax=Dendrobium thyrsiflorum TaxID=117978 RepID=A0ABD0VI95_DENTH